MTTFHAAAIGRRYRRESHTATAKYIQSISATGADIINLNVWNQMIQNVHTVEFGKMLKKTESEEKEGYHDPKARRELIVEIMQDGVIRSPEEVRKKLEERTKTYFTPITIAQDLTKLSAAGDLKKTPHKLEYMGCVISIPQSKKPKEVKIKERDTPPDRGQLNKYEKRIYDAFKGDPAPRTNDEIQKVVTGGDLNISKAIKSLTQKGILAFRNQGKSAPGRPLKCYYLKGTEPPEEKPKEPTNNLTVFMSPERRRIRISELMEDGKTRSISEILEELQKRTELTISKTGIRTDVKEFVSQGELRYDLDKDLLKTYVVKADNPSEEPKEPLIAETIHEKRKRLIMEVMQDGIVRRVSEIHKELKKRLGMPLYDGFCDQTTRQHLYELVKEGKLKKLLERSGVMVFGLPGSKLPPSNKITEDELKDGVLDIMEDHKPRDRKKIEAELKRHTSKSFTKKEVEDALLTLTDDNHLIDVTLPGEFRTYLNPEKRDIPAEERKQRILGIMEDKKARVVPLVYKAFIRGGGTVSNTTIRSDLDDLTEREELSRFHSADGRIMFRSVEKEKLKEVGESSDTNVITATGAEPAKKEFKIKSALVEYEYGNVIAKVSLEKKEVSISMDVNSKTITISLSDFLNLYELTKNMMEGFISKLNQNEKRQEQGI